MSRNRPTGPRAGAAEVSGKQVVVLICLLTAIGGALFLYLGPKATERRPGLLHLGVRYANEGSRDFLRYGGGDPATRVAFYSIPATEDEPVFARKDLERGRNLVPLEAVPDGNYVVRAEAEGFGAEEFFITVEDGRTRPIEDFPVPDDGHVARNMIGVRFEPARPPTDGTPAARER